MRIAYLTSYDSTDIRHWSGLGYYIAGSLERQGHELVRINCTLNHSPFQQVMGKLNKMCFGTIQQPERGQAYLKRMAGKAAGELRDQSYDLIFAAGSLPVTFLKSDKPIVFFTDATYDCMMDLYVDKSKLSRKSIAQGNQAEENAIHNASMVFYTSDWAVESAINRYHAHPDKIRQLHFGPNMHEGLQENEIDRIIKRRMRQAPVRFLFMGVDWYRKGAPAAIETVTRLNELGIPAVITIVGCQPPAGIALPNFVTNYPFISKSEEAGMNKLRKLFEQADFFLLPTKADCTPVVFSEAASYALPVITTNVGGCQSVVLHAGTGFCCSVENFVEEAVNHLAPLCYDRPDYEMFCERSFQHYKNELNWDVFGKKLTAAFEEVLQK